METTAYGLESVQVIESPYGHRLTSCDSIRNAILAIQEDERDAWYLPDSERNFAYWNGGKINYQFTDENGDSYCEFYCGVCAESLILSGIPPRSYLTSEMYSSEDEDTCGVCGKEVSN